MYDIIIIGGGPAGLTAATYARRAGKQVLVIEKNAFGGQITWSPRVENFPGYVSISGIELGDKLLEQAMEQGAETELEEVTALRRENGSWTVECESGAAFGGKALILATGAKPRMLGVAREEELVGSGVCYCAVCDGAFYAGRDVAVCGGGNSALQDALLLSESCRKVTLIHRRDSFRGEQKLVEALEKKDNVDFCLNTRVKALGGRLHRHRAPAGQRGLCGVSDAGRGRLCRERGGLPHCDAGPLRGGGLPQQSGPPAHHRGGGRRGGRARRLRVSGPGLISIKKHQGEPNGFP